MCHSFPYQGFSWTGRKILQKKWATYLRLHCNQAIGKRQIILHKKLGKAVSGEEEADGDTEGLGEEEATLTTTSTFMPVLRVNQFLLAMEIL